jgi:hypothetical protein
LIKHASGSRFLKFDNDYFELLGHDRDATMILCILEGWFNYKVEEVRSGHSVMVKFIDGKKVRIEDLLVFRTYEQLIEDSFGFLKSKNRVAHALKKLVEMRLISIRRNPNKAFEYDRRNFYQLNVNRINMLLAGLDLSKEEDTSELIDLSDTEDNPIQVDGSPTKEHGSPTQHDGSPAQDLNNNNLKESLIIKKQQTNKPRGEFVGGGSDLNINLTKDSFEQEQESNRRNKEQIEQEQESNQSNKEQIEQEKKFVSMCFEYIQSIDKAIPSDIVNTLISRLMTNFKGKNLNLEQVKLILAFSVIMGKGEIAYSDFSKIITDKNWNKQGIQERWIDPINQWLRNNVTIDNIRTAKKLGVADGMHVRLQCPYSYSNKINQAILTPDYCDKIVNKAKDIYDDNLDWSKLTKK